MMRYWHLFLLWRAGRRHAALRLRMRHHRLLLDRLTVQASEALDRVLLLRDRLPR